MRRHAIAALVLIPLALSLLPVRAHADELKKKYKQLKKENARLEQELAAKQADSAAAFGEATAAEAAAGMKFAVATAVSGPGVPDTYPAPGATCIALHVRHADYSLVPKSFQDPPRTIGVHRVQGAVLGFQRRNK